MDMYCCGELIIFDMIFLSLLLPPLKTINPGEDFSPFFVLSTVTQDLLSVTIT